METSIVDRNPRNLTIHEQRPGAAAQLRLMPMRVRLFANRSSGRSQSIPLPIPIIILLLFIQIPTPPTSSRQTLPMLVHAAPPEASL